MPERRLHLNPTTDELPRLFAFAAEAGLSDRATLALEEAVVNVVSYSGATAIEVSLTSGDGAEISITITDDGAPFDPTAYTPEPAADDAGDFPELPCVGGQGIRLITTLMDTVAYRRIDNKNILTITSSNGLQIPDNQ